MISLQVTYITTGALVCLYFALLTASSIREKRLRAVALSAGSLFLVAFFWTVWFELFAASAVILMFPLLVVVVIVGVLFVPVGRNDSLKLESTQERVDEREVIFAREEYHPGSTKYEQYYAKCPENLAIDDSLRSLPELLEPGGRYYDTDRSGVISKLFRRIEKLASEVDGPVGDQAGDVDPGAMTSEIKERLRKAGADDVGVATLDARHVYSHVGRGPETWGASIECDHRYAIVFTLEMDYQAVEGAPGLSITEESARKYLAGSKASISLAAYIRSLGFPARAHVAGSNYQIMLPGLAHQAGLGELGRIGYLVSPRLGARIRLGAITTDLPLVADRPINFGLQDFCRKCLKCANNCPSNAIPSGATVPVRGTEKWPLVVEQCLRYWRLIGTDCGLCMKVCPYSHPPTLAHNIVRAGIKRSLLARTLAVWGDDLFYGCKVAPSKGIKI